MWEDPRLQNTRPVQGTTNAYWLTEIADPVEDDYRLLDGVQVTDFVEPFWYLNIDAQQDNMNRLPYGGAGTYEFSCPTGYAGSTTTAPGTGDGELQFDERDDLFRQSARTAEGATHDPSHQPVWRAGLGIPDREVVDREYWRWRSPPSVLRCPTQLKQRTTTIELGNRYGDPPDPKAVSLQLGVAFCMSSLSLVRPQADITASAGNAHHYVGDSSGAQHGGGSGSCMTSWPADAHRIVTSRYPDCTVDRRACRLATQLGLAGAPIGASRGKACCACGDSRQCSRDPRPSA